MTNDLARWQFATTTIYHFFFVPVTIGLAFLVAILHTAWYRTDNPDYRRMTRFFGTLLLINVAIGVVTGLVQEFEFGMNWSTYSRCVGAVFGGPLAMEGLAAFWSISRLCPPNPPLMVGSVQSTNTPSSWLINGSGGGFGVACPTFAVFIATSTSDPSTWDQRPHPGGRPTA